MDNKTHHEIVCGRIADECCARNLGLVRGWRMQEARRLFEEALAAVIPKDAELNKGELALVKGMREKFNLAVITDVAFEAQANEQAQQLAMHVMNRTGARHLFGLVEDIVKEKSSAQGDELIKRAEWLYENYGPEGVADDKQGA